MMLHYTEWWIDLMGLVKISMQKNPCLLEFFWAHVRVFWLVATIKPWNIFAFFFFLSFIQHQLPTLKTAWLTAKTEKQIKTMWAITIWNEIHILWQDKKNLNIKNFLCPLASSPPLHSISKLCTNQTSPSTEIAAQRKRATFF